MPESRQETGSRGQAAKAIGSALPDVAPAWAQMRSQAKAGTIAPEMDLTAALLEAVAVMDRVRTSGRNVAEFTDQTDMLTGGGLSPTGRRFLRSVEPPACAWRRAPVACWSRRRELLADG